MVGLSDVQSHVGLSVVFGDRVRDFPFHSNGEEAEKFSLCDRSGQ